MFENTTPYFDPLLLIAALLLKHMLCDFPLQSARMLAEKRHYGNPWGILHALIHGAGSIVVLIVFSVPLPIILLICLAETVFHYHLDWSKEKLATRLSVQPDGRLFWILIGTDQMLHQFSYLIIAAGVTAA